MYNKITSADWFYEAFNNSPATESGMLLIQPRCLFVDLVNTVSRDNVSIQSTPVEDRYNIFTLKMWTMSWFCRGTIVTNCCLCLFASLYPSTSELPGDLRALKKATLVLNEGGDDWSPWNIGE